jgi:hypothetical protein
VTKRFSELLTKIEMLHESKNSDYSSDKQKLECFNESEAIDVPAFKGCFIRLGDKYRRAQQLIRKGQGAVVDEKLEDTMLDLAVYSLLFIELYEKHKQLHEERQQRSKN